MAAKNDGLEIEKRSDSSDIESDLVTESSELLSASRTLDRKETSINYNTEIISEAEQQFERELKEYNQMRILLVGKSGVGKSSFLNTIFGQLLAEVGLIQPETDAVNEYTFVTRKTGVKVKVYDTPGFGTDRIGNQKIIRQIGKTCEVADVIFLCIRMDDQFRAEDNIMITQLVKEFNADFWRKLLVVFTRANMVIPMGKHKLEKSRRAYLESVRDQLKSRVVEHLSKKKIDEPPFLIAGAPEFFSEDRKIPNIENKSSKESEVDWLPVVILKIFESGCSDNGKAVLLKSGWQKWINASAGSGVGSFAGAAAGGCIVAVGIATIPVPPVGIAVTVFGGVVILISLIAGTTSSSAFGTTAAVKTVKTKRRINEVMKETMKDKAQ